MPEVRRIDPDPVPTDVAVQESSTDLQRMRDMGVVERYFRMAHYYGSLAHGSGSSIGHLDKSTFEVFTKGMI